MKGVDYYYRVFDDIIGKANPDLAKEFIIFRSKNNVRHIWLWLETKKQSGEIPGEIQPFLDDFYSEVW